MLPPAPSPGSTPEQWVRGLGEEFAVFDWQDSGCVSYGVRVVPFDVGPSLVMPWLDGELIRGPGGWPRFRALPVPVVLAAVDTLLSAHRAVVEAGFVAVHLYAGSLMYDFEQHTLTLIDLDDYRPGPFNTGADRLPGSSRFMAPEEWGGGTTIDERTTVFVLGRAMRLIRPARRLGAQPFSAALTTSRASSCT